MLIAQRPSLGEEQLGDYRSKFTIEPLEPGFGYTIGNSLRRTLLSSIPGAAVTSIRIEGVLHEFTTVPGVKEDVTDLILNLKQLVVSSEHDEPVVMYLRKQGPGAVTAADIAPPAGVEVHNPELHIATLNSKGKLEMELTVERGRGYVSANQNKQPGQEIGRIPVTPSTRRCCASPTRWRPPASSSAPTSTGSSWTSRRSLACARVTRWPARARR
jgi:DNA-directed RNA polymerase subunit alpha